MSRIYFLFFIIFSLFSCEKEKTYDIYTRSPFKTVEIVNLLKDSISVRAIAIDSNKVWYATNKGTYGYCRLDKPRVLICKIKSKDNTPHFRGISVTRDNVFLLSTEKPSLIYKVTKKKRVLTKVFQDKGSKAFYNSIQFWNDREGIAMGDPQDKCLTILITRDGGETWNKLPCDKLPKIEEGEAAFAASNSNIVIKNNNTWIVTGGKKSRIFFSEDKGESWEVFNTPITHGKTMTGIYTADFHDEIIGFVAGGDYENQKETKNSKAVTINSGKTWANLEDKTNFGYSSCVQFVPDTGGRLMVSVGPNGIHFSDSSGFTWIKLHSEKDLYTIRFIDHLSAVAAGKNKIVKLNFKRD